MCGGEEGGQRNGANQHIDCTKALPLYCYSRWPPGAPLVQPPAHPFVPLGRSRCLSLPGFLMPPSSLLPTLPQVVRASPYSQSERWGVGIGEVELLRGIGGKTSWKYQSSVIAAIIVLAIPPFALVSQRYSLFPVPRLLCFYLPRSRSSCVPGEVCECVSARAPACGTPAALDLACSFTSSTAFLPSVSPCLFPFSSSAHPLTHPVSFPFFRSPSFSPRLRPPLFLPPFVATCLFPSAVALALWSLFILFIYIFVCFI